MSKAKEKAIYSFSGDLKVQTSKAYLVNLELPEKYKNNEVWIPKSKIAGTPQLLDLEVENQFTDKSGVPSFKYSKGKINGVCEAWVIASKVEKDKKEAESKEKTVEQPKEEVRSETKAGAPSVVNVNFDTSGLAILINGIAEQISGIVSQILDIKAFMKELLETLLKPEPKKSTKPKPKNQPTEANS